MLNGLPDLLPPTDRASAKIPAQLNFRSDDACLPPCDCFSHAAERTAVATPPAPEEQPVDFSWQQGAELVRQLGELVRQLGDLACRLGYLVRQLAAWALAGARHVAATAAALWRRRGELPQWLRARAQNRVRESATAVTGLRQKLSLRPVMRTVGTATIAAMTAGPVSVATTYLTNEVGSLRQQVGIVIPGMPVPHPTEVPLTVRPHQH